jgi:hypothetical protein
MPFSELMNDNVELLKEDGTRIGGLKASVQRTKIYMDAGKQVVETGDLILRKMSNGVEETYRVIDPGFYEAFGGIPANYQMDVQKLGLPEAKSAVQSITYNITGHNTRINQNTTDNSTNVVQIDARAIQHMAELRSEIEKADLSPAQKMDAIEMLDQVEDAFKSGKPKKSVVSALLNALPQVANVATIASAVIGLL